MLYKLLSLGIDQRPGAKQDIWYAQRGTERCSSVRLLGGNNLGCEMIDSPLTVPYISPY